MTNISATGGEPHRIRSIPDVASVASGVGGVGRNSEVASGGASADIDKAGRQFAELFLKQFVDAVVPKGEGRLFGGSEIWRSVFVDSIAGALSASDAFGLQHQLHVGSNGLVGGERP